jgi:hypothetical protein
VQARGSFSLANISSIWESHLINKCTNTTSYHDFDSDIIIPCMRSRKAAVSVIADTDGQPQTDNQSIQLLSIFFFLATGIG